jgi:hypothetical protein
LEEEGEEIQVRADLTGFHLRGRAIIDGRVKLDPDLNFLGSVLMPFRKIFSRPLWVRPENGREKIKASEGHRGRI